MAYNFNTSNNQQYSNTTDTNTQFQDWSFVPGSFHDVISFIGGSIPENLEVNTIIKDYLVLYGEQYEQIYIKSIPNFTFSNGIEIYELSGGIPDATGNGYLLEENNQETVTTFSFQNLDTFSDSYINSRVDFQVFGKNPNEALELIETESYYIRVRRIDYNDVFIIGTEFFHLIGNNFPDSKDLYLYVNGDFTVSVKEHVNLSGGNLVYQSTAPDGTKTYSGTNSQIVQASLAESIESLGDIQGYQALITLDNGSNSKEDSVVVNQYSQPFLDISPQAMSFFAIKEIQESGDRFLSIETYGPWSITHPLWLTVSQTSGEHSQNLISVKPIHSLNLSEGDYLGTLSVSSQAGTKEVLIKHKVVGRIDLNLEVDGINFTKDRETISRFYRPTGIAFSQIGQRIGFQMTSRVYDYNVPVFNELTTFHIKSFIKNKTDFFFGKIIDQLMPTIESLEQLGFVNFSEITNNIIRYYNPSDNQVNINYVDDSSLNSDEYSENFNAFFIKGRKPQRILNDSGIISFIDEPLRVTKNSKAILNILNRFNNVYLSKYINGVFQGSILTYLNTNELIGHLLEFSDAVEGDIYEYRLSHSQEPSENFVSQKYLVFPENKQSVHIGWEDEHGLLQILEFTGDYKIENEISGISSETFKDYLVKSKKLGSKQSSVLFADTGFILKSNQEYISSLLSADIAWVIFDNIKEIELIPKSKKLIATDSDKELYAYEIEFTINKQHELENITL